MATSKILITTSVPLISTILYLLYVGYQRRSRIEKLRKQGVAMPPWSWWMGHLLVLKEKLDGLPPDANVYYAMQDLVLKDHADTEIFLMDYWPMFDPVLMVSGPEPSVQVANTYNLPKPREHRKFFYPIVGGESLITMEGTEWKFWRSLLNPGFSAAHMLSLVPSIVESVEVFCSLLRERAGKEIFSLDDLTTRLTMEIITKIALDTNLNNQRSEHPISRALNTILDWHSYWDPRILLNPLRPIVQWYYSRVIYKFIRKEVDQRFSELVSSKPSASVPSKRAKSVVSLALESYIDQKSKSAQASGEYETENLILDERFADVAVSQTRLFILAGNDSTSTTIVYCYHLLSKHPEALAKIQNEHDEVFGPDQDSAALLKSNPTILNQCKYTLAVIKETLRLFPAASSLRDGCAGVSITDKDGRTYPTEGLAVTLMHHFIHRNPRFWPRPTEFIPERWLVEPGHELYVSQSTGAFRPFETGSRNCIGQTLVYNEIAVVLVLTLRTFSVASAYDEWDAAQLQNEGVTSQFFKKIGLRAEVPKTVMGERAYQTSKSGSHPANGYPCRVSIIG